MSASKEGENNDESTDSNDKFVARKTSVYSDSGHTSIPKEVRDRLGFEEGDEVAWIGYGDKIFVTRLSKDE